MSPLMLKVVAVKSCKVIVPLVTVRVIAPVDVL